MKATNTFQRMRSLAAMGFLGCATLALMPLGCGGIKTVAFRQQPTTEHPALPRVTAERLSACVRDYGSELGGRSWGFSPKVKADNEGRVLKVDAGDFPENARDFGACIQVTLKEMTVPEWILRLRPAQDVAATNGKTIPAGNALANPIVVLEVLVALAELVIEWEGIEIEFAVILEMVAAAAAETQVAVETTKQENEKDKCTDYYEACIMSALFGRRGNHWRQTRCGICARVCVKNDGEWPFDVGGKTCEYEER